MKVSATDAEQRKKRGSQLFVPHPEAFALPDTLGTNNVRAHADMTYASSRLDSNILSLAPNADEEARAIRPRITRITPWASTVARVLECI